MTSMHASRMTPKAALLTLAAATLLSGCATTYCSSAQPYETAKSIPPIVAPEGMRIPTPSTALKVPEVKTESVTYGFYGPDSAKPGKKRMYCLDQPPSLKVTADATP